MTESIESASTEAFEHAIDDYISWAVDWDGSLPADVFFGVWADLQHEKKPLEIHARIVQGQLQFTSPVEGAIKVADNSIYLEDGRQLVIQLQAAA